MNKKEFIEELNQAKEDVYNSYICSLEADLARLREDNAEYKRINEGLTRQLREELNKASTSKPLNKRIHPASLEVDIMHSKGEISFGEINKEKEVARSKAITALEDAIKKDDIQERRNAESKALQYIQEAVRKGADFDFLVEQTKEIKEFEDRNG